MEGILSVLGILLDFINVVIQTVISLLKTKGGSIILAVAFIPALIGIIIRKRK